MWVGAVKGMGGHAETQQRRSRGRLGSGHASGRALQAGPGSTHRRLPRSPPSGVGTSRSAHVCPISPNAQPLSSVRVGTSLPSVVRGGVCLKQPLALWPTPHPHCVWPFCVRLISSLVCSFARVHSVNVPSVADSSCQHEVTEPEKDVHSWPCELAPAPTPGPTCMSPSSCLLQPRSLAQGQTQASPQRQPWLYSSEVLGASLKPDEAQACQFRCQGLCPSSDASCLHGPQFPYL